MKSARDPKPTTFCAVSLFALVAVTVVNASPQSSVASNRRSAWNGFVYAGDLGASAIYAANPDGSRAQLTHPHDGIEDGQPDWSPDGSTIDFQRPTSRMHPTCRPSPTNSCASMPREAA